MALKVIVCLLLITLARALENEDESPVAYSSVYTSFGDPKEETSENAKTNSPIIIEQENFNPVYEVFKEQISDETQGEQKVDNEQANEPQTVNQDSIIYSIPNVQPIQSESSASSQPAPVDDKTILTPVSVPVTKATTNPPFSSAVIGKGRYITPGLSAFASSGEEIENEPAKVTIVELEAPKADSEPKESDNSVAPIVDNVSDSFRTTASETSKDLKSSDSQLSNTETQSHASFDGFGTSFSW